MRSQPLEHSVSHPEHTVNWRLLQDDLSSLPECDGASPRFSVEVASLTRPLSKDAVNPVPFFAEFVTTGHL